MWADGGAVAPGAAGEGHQPLHKITVLEIDLTTDSYLTAFLE